MFGKNLVTQNQNHNNINTNKIKLVVYEIKNFPTLLKYTSTDYVNSIPGPFVIFFSSYSRKNIFNNKQTTKPF